MKTPSNKLKRLALSGIAAVALMGTFTSRALGGTWCGVCKPYCRYEWVCTYEVRRVPYYHYVTRYDHCGRPYCVKVLCYKTVRVPVKRLVEVCD